MNERIRKLAEQAGVEFDESFSSEPETIYYLGLSHFEKFAELIIGECFGEIMCQLYDYNPSSNEQYNAGHEAGLKLAVSKIKQHFGVKE